MRLITEIKEYYRNLRKQKQLTKKLIWVTLHACWLVILTILLQYIPFTRPGETDFLKWAAIWRHDIFMMDVKPKKDSVVFIDVSHDLSLIPDPKITYDAISPFKGPEQVITDRQKLAYLFSIINKHPGEYKYVICDVLFEDNAPEDSLLKVEIEKPKNLITTAILDENDNKLVQPVFNIPFGVVNYTALNHSMFYKMPIIYDDSLKSLPVKLFEKTSGNYFFKKYGLIWRNNKLSFNTIIPEFYYRTSDLVYSEGKTVNAYYMGELLLFGDASFEAMRNKYIIIGNFSDDIHSTYLGKIPGALILWDTFLTLQSRPINVSIQWLLTLFIIYWIISYKIIIHPEEKFENLTEKIKKIRFSFLKKFLLKYISYLGVVLIINFLSFVLLGVFISLFYIVTYLTFFELTINEFHHWIAVIKKYYDKLNFKKA
jgi:hypothetical protein